MKKLVAVIQKWVAVIVLALVAGALLLSATPAHASTTFTVTLTSDVNDRNLPDGRCDVSAEPGLQCTLRAAMREANATPAADVIHFDIPGGGVKTIRPTAELPFIMEPLTINGYTQPGARPNTAAVGTNAVLKIQLDGISNARGSDGLHVHAPHTVIQGLAIGRFREGIEVHRDFNQSGANYVRITGCFIGTDASGTQARPNQTGIEVHTSHVFIGGDRIGSRNLISGNTGNGVKLRDEVQTGARVLGNWIGTDRTGASRMGNGRSGIYTEQSEGLIGYDSTGNAGNTIQFNGSNAVTVVLGSGNRILRNAIAGNGGLGIDLNDDGVSSNDAGDADGGANSTQNKPNISSATVSDGTTTIEGKLTSTPNETFDVQFFSNPSGNEGRDFLIQRSVTTVANGSAPFTFSFPRAVPTGQTITATATGAEGTSEFSATVRVT